VNKRKEARENDLKKLNDTLSYLKQLKHSKAKAKHSLVQNSIPWVRTNSTIISFYAFSDRSFRVYDAVSLNDPGVA